MSRHSLGSWEDELTEFWTPNRDEFLAAVPDAMVKMYFAKWSNQCDYVGLVSGDPSDLLIEGLRKAGERFDEAAIRETPKVNESPAHGDLILEALWKMGPEELAALDAAAVNRLPVELAAKVPADALAAMPADELKKLVRKLSHAANPMVRL